ncbi:anti sigma factor C-terminal domain-containing protein [Streptococcus ovuberis]|uniref:Sigma factor regulator C-terminal domain-containing protein n=1 Tax=Streptococcus ovuberis TaxID=1936207 RepID=A0A7X6S2C5_9STRE|nr:anti sigma factor C-terminal domain-containing protein [Streptococcus ovuberis]NKZ21245.1 hypothetical protein [Streptococcus ovuberis]
MEAFELLTKKRQKKAIKRTILISSVVTFLGLVLVLLGVMGLELMAQNNYNRLQDYYFQRLTVAFPNIDFGSPSMRMKRFGGEYKDYLTKDILGIAVPYDDLEATYSISGFHRDHSLEYVRPANVTQDATEMAYSPKKHLKSPLFFNPQAEYGPEDIIRKPAQELPYVSKMENQLVEVALTFKQRYTLEEIQTFIPKNLKVNWLWIGSETKLNSSKLLLGDLFGWKPRQPYLDESFQEFTAILENVYQEQAKVTISSQQKLLNQDLAHFLDEAKQGMSNARFGGVILTGRAEDFAQLEEMDWIYATSIGISIPNQPYYTLGKE